jgi:hypothetical protein
MILASEVVLCTTLSKIIGVIAEIVAENTTYSPERGSIG